MDFPGFSPLNLWKKNIYPCFRARKMWIGTKTKENSWGVDFGHFQSDCTLVSLVNGSFMSKNHDFLQNPEKTNLFFWIFEFQKIITFFLEKFEQNFLVSDLEMI